MLVIKLLYRLQNIGSQTSFYRFAQIKIYFLFNKTIKSF
ncbi:hypothetical protein RC62_2870 [Flavobacterium aquidurense]|uniref:Uncharacterized protein n=1 Tax=Flavobacterium aquidurense TaxID=362413 RepID=A0A0Q0XPC6_9FLAO|nr:hypothetical protein RC62_2870 [Flavobacterium aquidurense]